MFSNIPNPFLLDASNTFQLQKLNMSPDGAKYILWDKIIFDLRKTMLKESIFILFVHKEAENEKA